MLVGLSLLDVCLAMSEKLNFGTLLKNGLFADAAAVDWNENIEDAFAVVVAGVENRNPVEDVVVAVILPKLGNENPLLVLVDGFNDAPSPNIGVFVSFNDVELRKIDVLEVSLKFPKIDGLLSHCDVIFEVDDGDSTDVEVCFCNWDWDFSRFVNENLIFSLELNGNFDAGAVDSIWGAKTKNK